MKNKTIVLWVSIYFLGGYMPLMNAQCGILRIPRAIWDAVVTDFGFAQLHSTRLKCVATACVIGATGVWAYKNIRDGSIRDGSIGV